MLGIIFWFGIGYCAHKYSWFKKVVIAVEEILEDLDNKKDKS